MGTKGSTKSPAIGPNNLGGPAMGGKMHGGGVNLAPKKENTGGGMDPSQRKVTAGAYDSFGQAKVISGGHPKGGFMHKSKSYSPTKGQGYDAREDEALGMKDGKESSKKQSDKDRRDESRGENKAQGNPADGLTKYPTRGPHKDYDGDGKQESSTQEYLGSVDKAIKKNKK